MTKRVSVRFNLNKKNDFDDERKFGRDETELNLEVVQKRQADYKEYRNQLEVSGN